MFFRIIILKKIIPIFLFFLLAGCSQTIPPINFSVANVGPSSQKIPAELRSITVSMARPDEQLGMLSAGDEIVTPIWKSALEDSLNRMAVFQDDAPRKVSISVKVLKIDLPGAGFSMTTKSSARYEIIDRTSGGLFYTKQIDSVGVTPADFAYLGMARARESMNRSVQNNIALFLRDLETLDLSKPAFPASARPVGPAAKPVS